MTDRPRSRGSTTVRARPPAATSVAPAGTASRTTRVARDDRATGLRDHKRDRRVARASLKSGEDDALPNGKRRRYSERYGAYEL